MPANGVSTAKNSSNEGLSYDCDLWTCGVFGAEVTTCNAGNAQGLEIARRGHEEGHDWICVGSIGPAFSMKRVTSIASAERWRIRYNCGLNAGQSGDALLQLAKKCDGAFGSIAVHARIDGHHQ